MHIQANILPQLSVSMVAENGLGAELLSECGVLSILSEDLLSWFFCECSKMMLDFIILDKLNFHEICLNA